MKLCRNSIKEFEKKGYKIPLFEVEKVVEETKKNPVWIHFGAGNLFRGFPAQKQQDLLNSGNAKAGIIVVETFDEEIIEKTFTPFDNLTINLSLKADGNIEKTIVASIAEAYAYSRAKNRIVEVFESETLQICSFTITEKGYSTQNANGELLPYIKADIDNFENPAGVLAIVTKLLYTRFKSKNQKIALVSLDNCSHNGTLLQNAVQVIADAWVQQGKVQKEFAEYVRNKAKVSFTWSMIDKITPRPSEEMVARLEKDGVSDVKITKTAKNTYASAFVNAEECEYLAIEDKFPNGRPQLEKTGVMFADRETIDKIEKMKVCTCLNPLHTALAIFGCLLEFDSISSEMKDATLRTLIEKIGYLEGMPVVVDPKIMSAEKFIDECINKRFPNPYVPDTPQRIACDTSKKLPVRFGETLKAYIAKGQKDLSFLKYIPLVFAGWARYLIAKTDNLQDFELSPDPNITRFKPFVENIKIGEKNDLSSLKNIFSSAEIFGVDLYAHNLGNICEKYFEKMISGKGCVRKTLDEILEL